MFEKENMIFIEFFVSGFTCRHYKGFSSWKRFVLEYFLSRLINVMFVLKS